VTPRQVRAAVADSDFAPVAGTRPLLGRVVPALALLVLGGVAGATLLQWLERGEDPRPAAAPPAKKVPAAAPAPQVEAPKAGPTEPKTEPKTGAAQLQSAPLLSQEQMRRLEGYGAGRNALLRERLAATRERLAAEPDASYSIELFQADNSDPERTERFLIRARDLVPLSELYVIPLAKGGSHYRLRVVYGMFAGKQAAADAAKRLPPKYQNAFRFELRSLADLRSSI
jgi:hypothetical protein